MTVLQKTKEAIKSVLCNIASSYGLSDSIYYSYDKKGKLKQTQETIKYSNGNYTYIFKDGKGNLKEEQKVIFNKNENLTTYDTTFSDGGRFVHKTIGTENSHIASYEEYADGELVSITHSEYDKNYLNGSSVEYNSDKSEILNRTVSKFDPETNIKTSVTYDGKNMQVDKMLEYYNAELNSVFKYEYYDSNNNLEFSIEYIRSDQDMLQARVKRGSNGKMKYKTEYKQDGEVCYLYDNNENEYSSYTITSWTRMFSTDNGLVN